MGTVFNGTNISGNGDLQYAEKCQEYLDYINEHVENVKKAFNNLFRCPGNVFIFPGYSIEETERLLNEVEELIENHDQSKYSDDEFYAYRRKFHFTELEKVKMDHDSDYVSMVDFEFEEAWKHHYKTNDHHPMYWLGGDGTPGNMIPTAIIHMISDWEAMSIKFGGSTVDWYNNKAKKEKEAMSKDTKDTVEKILGTLFKEPVYPEVPKYENS